LQRFEFTNTFERLTFVFGTKMGQLDAKSVPLSRKTHHIRYFCLKKMQKLVALANLAKNGTKFLSH